MTFTVSGGFVGSDPDELDRLAVEFERRAAAMREIASSSTWALRTAAWTGNKIGHIRAEWDRESRPTILSAAGELDYLSRELRRQATQQRHTSRAEGGSAPRYEPYPPPKTVKVKQVDHIINPPVACTLADLLRGID